MQYFVKPVNRDEIVLLRKLGLKSLRSVQISILEPKNYPRSYKKIFIKYVTYNSFLETAIMGSAA